MSLVQLLCGCFPQHLLHLISCAAAYCYTYAETPFNCPLCSSQALVKMTQNPSMTYLSDCTISWITYACHITRLCCLLLVLGNRFSQKQINYFYGLCGLTWPLVWHCCWEADAVFQLATLAEFFSGKGLYPAHDKYFLSIFQYLYIFTLMPLVCPRIEGFFCLCTGRKESLL